MKLALNTALVTGAALLLPTISNAADAWYPYTAEAVNPAFSADGTTSKIVYNPLEKTEKAWNICVSFPHMKDAYWLGVDYGVADEAARLGVKMNLVEAGGYTDVYDEPAIRTLRHF